ncbi:hypothetical protein [Marinobacter sp.]|uniref:hypothetical protein n=1 Tax=Marinobacter sp. TaxID=50741 RepID=UPI003A8E9806
MKDLIVASVWFISLVAINFISGEPTQFIWAYAVPVIMITWKHDLQWGFLAAAVGAFAAVASGAVTGNANAGISLAEEGLFTFAQLSAIAIGLVLGQKTHDQFNNWIN